MPNLTKSAYQGLLSDITQIYARANAQAQETLEHIRTRAYWEIGKRIVTVEQKNDLRSEYGEKLLESLSEDLSGKLGSGFSRRNLFYMRQFYLAYPIVQTSAQLHWSDYQVLSSIPDNETRKAFEKKVLKNNWTTRELKRALKTHNVKLKQILAKKGRSKPEQAVAKAPIKIQYTRGQLGLVTVVDHHDANKELISRSLDLGFEVFYTGIDVARKEPGTIFACTKDKDEWQIAPSKASAKERYTYVARFLRAIDGDTVLVQIECGFGVYHEARLRLRGINAPELDTKQGKTAQGFVERTLNTVEFTVIRTHGTDIYGRYLVDIFYLPGEEDPHVVARDGMYFNQELLDEGLARPYLPQG